MEFVVFVGDETTTPFNYFTTGKLYKVVKSSTILSKKEISIISILDDSGNTYFYPNKKDGFIELDEYRNLKISNILE